MTIGTGSFIPGGQYNFPRSYIYDLHIARYGDTLTHVNELFTIHAVPPDPTIAIIQFLPAFWTWNSNVYSLDHLVINFYALVGGVGPAIPLNYLLTWNNNPTYGRASLFFYWSSGAPDFEVFTLDQQPPTYWLPPPMP